VGKFEKVIKMKRIAISFRKGCCEVGHFHSPVFSPETPAEVEYANQALNREIKSRNLSGWRVISMVVIDVEMPKNPE